MTEVLTYNGLETYDTLIKDYIGRKDDAVLEQAQQQISDIEEEQEEHGNRIRRLEGDTAITIAELDEICV